MSKAAETGSTKAARSSLRKPVQYSRRRKKRMETGSYWGVCEIPARQPLPCGNLACQLRYPNVGPCEEALAEYRLNSSRE